MIPHAPNPTVLCIHASIKLKVCLIAKDDFLRKISVHFLVFQQPINKFSALHMVCWLEFLRQLNLVSMQMQIFREIRCMVLLEMSNCCEPWQIDVPGLSATLPRTVAILSREQPVR